MRFVSRYSHHIILLAAIAVGCSAPSIHVEPRFTERATVVRVVDGDTIVIDDHIAGHGEKVYARLTGPDGEYFDAFEIHHGERIRKHALAAGITDEEALRCGLWREG